MTLSVNFRILIIATTYFQRWIAVTYYKITIPFFKMAFFKLQLSNPGEQTLGNIEIYQILKN